MHFRSTTAAINFQRYLVSTKNKAQIDKYELGKRVVIKPYDVFINHRGRDTKKTVATLLYDNLYWLNLHPFLDNKNMKPGDKLFDKIDSAIKDCKVGVAVFSPTYCDSLFCLHELSLMMETNKKVIPIFCDIKPSQLRVVKNIGKYSMEDLRRFNWALEEAKLTVGLTFDSVKGNLSDVIRSATDIIIHTLVTIESEKRIKMLQKFPIHTCESINA